VLDMFDKTMLPVMPSRLLDRGEYMHCCGSETASSTVVTGPFRMDLHEGAESNIVTATFELPGLNKDNVQIDVQNGRLSISGETEHSSEHKESGYAVRERKHGKFTRTLQLPRGITVSNQRSVWVEPDADETHVGGPN
jgi:HSP20 family molecular chaperone IbpA